MKIYFTYTRKQRSSALLLMVNACVLLLMYLAAHQYLPNLTTDTSALEELFGILDIAIWVVEAILIALALWFWFENKAVQVRVTETSLFYNDPTFNDVSWEVAVADIVELKQTTDSRQDYTTNLIVLKNGEQKQLMYGNYRGFDRRAFFDALLSANSNISVPESVYRYAIQRPLWATRIRKKLGLKH
ncbi:hypothetical protein KO489_05795 [Reinekea forsetii]|nr:hypothetical protein [Reinekea forsetii]